MKFRRLLGAGLTLCALGAAAVLALWPATNTIEVGSHQSLQAAVDEAPPGATLMLAAGVYEGPVVVDEPVSLVGVGLATIRAPSGVAAALDITASGVRVDGIRVTGGASGVVVRAAERVILADVDVTGAELHGIEVVDASAHISEASVGELTSPYAQGIEVRNSDGRPDTVVAHSVVTGGQEGIVSHVSEVVFEHNSIRTTTMRALVVTEMSDGVVRFNTVRDAAGVGLYCGDMSRCAFEDNDVARVVAGEGGRSSAGWGLVVNYHATAWEEGNSLTGEAGEVATFVTSRLAQSSPLELGSGYGALVPGSLAVLVSALLLGAAGYAGRRLLRSPGEGETTGARALWAGGRATSMVWTAVVVGVGVQAFHMTEHFLQVYRVHVDGLPSRGGIVGPAVDAEWIHFAYNLLVFVMIVAVAAARRAGWPRTHASLSSSHGDYLLGGGLVIQGYHVVEHSTKLIQHLVTGHKVNPGILGGEIDLVWLHFSVNLAVFAGFVLACLAYAPTLVLSASGFARRNSRRLEAG